MLLPQHKKALVQHCTGAFLLSGAAEHDGKILLIHCLLADRDT